MTKEGFTTLSLEDKASALWDNGRFLESVSYYKYKANLYALDDFFVEVLCCQGSTSIEQIDVADEEKLSKFLSRIDLASLYTARL